MKAKKKKLEKKTLKDFGLENEKRLKVLKVTGKCYTALGGIEMMEANEIGRTCA
jgi:electron transfer flavoprotein alpha/beta subunit